MSLHIAINIGFPQKMVIQNSWISFSKCEQWIFHWRLYSSMSFWPCESSTVDRYYCFSTRSVSQMTIEFQNAQSVSITHLFCNNKSGVSKPKHSSSFYSCMRVHFRTVEAECICVCLKLPQRRVGWRVYSALQWSSLSYTHHSAPGQVFINEGTSASLKQKDAFKSAAVNTKRGTKQQN